MTVGEASRQYQIALEFERSMSDAHAGLHSFDSELGRVREETENAHSQLVDAIFDGLCPR